MKPLITTPGSKLASSNELLQITEYLAPTFSKSGQVTLKGSQSWKFLD